MRFGRPLALLGVSMVASVALVVGTATPSSALVIPVPVTELLPASEALGPAGVVAAGVVIGGYYLWHYRHQVLGFVNGLLGSGSNGPATVEAPAPGSVVSNCGEIVIHTAAAPGAGPASSGSFSVGYSGPSSCIRFGTSAMVTFGSLDYVCQSSTGSISAGSLGSPSSPGGDGQLQWDFPPYGPETVYNFGDLCSGSALVEVTASAQWGGYRNGPGEWRSGAGAGTARVATVHLDCRDASGATATLDYSAPYTVGAGGAGTVDVHDCSSVLPNGTVVGATVHDGYPGQVGGGNVLVKWQPTNLPTVSTDPLFQCWFPVDPAPVCLVHVQYRQADGTWVDCTSALPECNDLQTKRALSPADYRVLWGTTILPWSDAAQLGPDPYPAAAPAPQPSASPSPGTGGQPQPSSSASPGTGTGTGTGASPGPCTGAAVGTIGCAPATGTSTDPASDGSSCSGSWSFNPVDWVLRPVECALRWAFVPDAAHLNRVTTLTDDALGRAPFGYVTSGLSWVGGLVPGGPSCWQERVSIPHVADFTAIDTCTPGPVEGKVMALRGLLTVAMFAALFLPLAWWAWRTYAPGATGSG